MVRATNRAAAFLLLPAVVLAWSGPARGLDHLVLQRQGRQLQLQGRNLLVARDGGTMLQTRDGTIWIAQPKEIVGRSADDQPFVPYRHDELADRLLPQLPPGFDVHQTAHYVILYSTSPAYARWCGALFERLHMAFTNYWKRKGFKLTQPEFPLVAVVFADKASYVRFARDEVGQAVGSVVAYYSLRTNRITMYDLTGVEAYGAAAGRTNTAAQINRILSRPGAMPTVATIVHEATHQIAYNSGLQTRYSDCPLWVSEGIAMYFETPDLTSSRGWRGIGQVNTLRLDRFRRYLFHRPADSLGQLLTDDDRLRDSQSAADAYAETWALTYFLIQKYPRQYVAYLEVLSKKKPQVWDDAPTRLKEFRQAFGLEPARIDQEMVRFYSR